MATVRRVLLHVDDGLRQIVDPDDVYYLEALLDETSVRLRRARPVIDVRPLGELLRSFEPFGFVRIHRSYAVNLTRIRLFRRRARGKDWEVKLQPPVNRLLPVSREYNARLLAAFEGKRVRRRRS
ncbi:MAG: LytTR family transcriptional regulator DNA-binding domain-containing protein, partial [Candidatus Krumholzibacteriia bacterium]